MNTIRAITLRPALRVLNLLLGIIGYVVVKKRDQHGNADYTLHKYKSYEEYRESQIAHNKSKIDAVWADKATLKRVAKIARGRSKAKTIKGLCHGTRNGFEQNFLNSLGLGIQAIGTDISDTAKDYENSVQWDFHDVKPEWQGQFDFVYTNSLDQSWQPKAALTTWLGQIKKDGVVIIEHTEDHAAGAAGEMDPFGVRPAVMPFVLTMWFGEQISISHSVAVKDNKHIPAWLFVISKNTATVKPLDGDDHA